MNNIVEAGPLNCEGGPEQIAAGAYVDYRMEVGVPDLDLVGGRLVWLLGSEGDEGASTERYVLFECAKGMSSAVEKAMASYKDVISQGDPVPAYFCR